MDFDQALAEVKRNLAAVHELMSQLSSVQVHQAAQLVSHEKLIQLQQQRLQEAELWRSQQEAWKRQQEEWKRHQEEWRRQQEEWKIQQEEWKARQELLNIRWAEFEERHRRFAEQHELRMAEFDDKLNGLIGFMEGYFRKE
jgi:hypothetical protein